MVICICRGTSEREIERSIANGASSLRDLQRCGTGDQCGSCHNALRAMLARSAETEVAPPCPACTAAASVAVPALA